MLNIYPSRDIRSVSELHGQMLYMTLQARRFLQSDSQPNKIILFHEFITEKQLFKEGNQHFNRIHSKKFLEELSPTFLL
jgi:hypothetical protein